jgi:3-oxoacyl-[acyl-carrier protein] reductase
MLAGSVALVTGGSRGIGAATCRRLAAHGAAVAIGYRDGRARAEGIARAIEADGGRALPVGFDVASGRAGRRALERTQEALGGLDVLVHNAWPGWRSGSFESLDWDDFQRYLDGMLRPAVELTRAALPALRGRRRGRIVLLGSTSMYELNPQHSPYVAAKGALLALTRSLASELGRDGVTVNMVSPSLVWTGDGPEPDEFGAAHRARNAFGRLPTADEVAGAVVFLASPLADAITGVQIPVSCGSPMQVG